ncbi:cytochrome c oxidase subunit 6b-1 [Mercurialis annua]|uniref:cytochrome c oxidase subunit 6b-1 n=1 Tax=Mercurialis annua TaxID=3986 RepID=UPI0021604DBE|nr:cytochrome c oxidase subunit 6b-1 [Mercurialis annua]
MADTATSQTPSLSQHYLLEKSGEVGSKPVEVKEDAKPETTVSAEPAAAKVEEAPAAAAAEEIAQDTTPAAAAAEETTEINTAAESSSQDTPADDAESSETSLEESSNEPEAADEAPEIKLETAPADFRFPTTNQSRHCFTRYVEYHRCVAAKGEGAQECDKFAKFYRSLCPGEWVDRWNEQRENGTFPGPL